MTELKILEDITPIGEGCDLGKGKYDGDWLYLQSDLKQELIKWAKELERISQIAWDKVFLRELKVIWPESAKNQVRPTLLRGHLRSIAFWIRFFIKEEDDI